jgi:hypothetical protein
MCCVLINTACKQADEPINDYTDYYIPVSTLPGEGAVYNYRSVNDSLAPPEIWKHTRLGPDRLESINYTPDGFPILRQYDRIVPTGVLTDSLILLLADGTGSRVPVHAKILSPYRFPFQPGDTSKVWLTKMDWFQSADSLHYVLQRRRQFEADTIWNHKGKTIPAVRFKVEDTLETEAVGWTTSSWTGIEIYAKGIGLVYYKRRITDGMVLEFALEE